MGTLGWLTWRVSQRGSSTFIAGGSAILPPDAYFFTVRAAGSQIGVASISVDTLSDGVEISELMGLDIPIYPENARSQYISRYRIGTDLRLREFSITLPTATDPIVQHGTVEGDSVIVVTPGTGEPRWRVPLGTRQLIPPLAAPVSLALQQKLRTGERHRILTFDPVTLEDRAIAIEVTDDSLFLVPDSAEFDTDGGVWMAVHSDTIRAWKLTWSDGDQVATMWVDGRGLPIRIISPSGLELDRSAFEIVTINYRRRRPPRGEVRPQGIVPRSTVAGQVRPAGNVTSMRVAFATAAGPWTIPDDTLPFQSVEGDSVVTIISPLDTSTSGYRLPAPDSTMAAWLADAPHLGLRDTAIAQRARAIIGGETSPTRAARLLVDWVSGTIGRVPEPAVPRAATVLRNRQADVDGHTVLFVALARAVGLPARPVGGIVLAGDRFYLHSWAEVYLGSWVPVDPTWGGLPAAADRIRFTSGSLSRPHELLPLVAGLDAQLITLTRRP